MIRSVTDSTASAIGCPVDSIQVIIEEYSKDNWGISGEQTSEKYLD